MTAGGSHTGSLVRVFFFFLPHREQYL